MGEFSIDFQPGQPAGWDRFAGRQQAAHDPAAVAVVATASGVGDDAGDEVACMPPGQGQGGGKGIVDIASLRKRAAHELAVGEPLPGREFGGGDPVAAMLEDRLTEGGRCLGRRAGGRVWSG